jgi:hypothetical protein
MSSDKLCYEKFLELQFTKYYSYYFSQKWTSACHDALAAIELA